MSVMRDRGWLADAADADAAAVGDASTVPITAHDERHRCRASSYH